MNMQNLFNETLLNPLPLMLAIIAISFILIPIVDFLNKLNQYKKSTYYEITKNSYLSVLCDKGKYGEYLVYENLSFQELSGGKFLFNLYLPDGNNATTEIDILLICSKGLFVIESKNYDGWICQAPNLWSKVKVSF